MNKEELESNFEDCFIASTRPSEGGYGPDVTDGRKLWSLLDPIVASYTKQQAIAFDVWKRENCITYDYENKSYSQLIFLDVDHTKVRTEQLSIDYVYNQFIEQQNKR